MKAPLTLIIAILATLAFIALPDLAADKKDSANKPEVSDTSKADKKAKPTEKEETTVIDFLSDKLVDANGKKVSGKSLKGKTVGIYFSADWCPPCHQFTPLLIEFREKHKDEFEVVFASMDNSLGEKKDYMSNYKMKWPTLDGVQSLPVQQLYQVFQVPGTPTLVIIDEKGTPITANGTEHIMTNPKGALKMWQDASKSSEG